MTVGYYKNYLYTHRYKLNSEKKKKKKKVPVHGFAPETGSDSPIGSDRDRGRDKVPIQSGQDYKGEFTFPNSLYYPFTLLLPFAHC